MDRRVLWLIGAGAAGLTAFALSKNLRRFVFADKVILNCRASMKAIPEFADITVTNNTNHTFQAGEIIYRRVDGALKDVYGNLYKKTLTAPLAPDQSFIDTVLGKAGVVHTCEAWAYV